MGWLSRTLYCIGPTNIDTCRDTMFTIFRERKNSKHKDDLFTVVCFNEVPRTVVLSKPFSEYSNDDKKKISELLAEGDTALFDAIEYCKNVVPPMVAKTYHVDRVDLQLIIFTDGKDTASKETEIKKKLKEQFKINSKSKLVAFIFITGDTRHYFTGGNSSGDDDNIQVWFIPCTDPKNAKSLLDKAAIESRIRFNDTILDEEVALLNEKDFPNVPPDNIGKKDMQSDNSNVTSARRRTTDKKQNYAALN